MTTSRYVSTPVLGYGTQYGTSTAVSRIRSAVNDGRLPVDELVLRGAERLDTLAGSIYGDARYWWVLAAASGVGWGLQIPPGTIVNVPSLEAVFELIR
jgi:hypothetical protein